MAERRFQTFAEFWPFYVAQHSKRLNRALHFIGSALGLAALVALVVLWRAFPMNLLFVPAGLVVGYGFAWVGHFVVQKNRPATFLYPWWSFVGDWKMFVYILMFRMGGEVERVCGGRNVPAHDVERALTHAA
ncbi:MAG: DUF962 domain-containing protein [Euryarchaeota archaeon]|nr:DUF962 domain-containing protein [Euryarchaeota archaeon]